MVSLDKEGCNGERNMRNEMKSISGMVYSVVVRVLLVRLRKGLICSSGMTTSIKYNTDFTSSGVLVSIVIIMGVIGLMWVVNSFVSGDTKVEKEEENFGVSQPGDGEPEEDEEERRRRELEEREEREKREEWDREDREREEWKEKWRKREQERERRERVKREEYKRREREKMEECERREMEKWLREKLDIEWDKMPRKVDRVSGPMLGGATAFFIMWYGYLFCNELWEIISRYLSGGG